MKAAKQPENEENIRNRTVRLGGTISSSKEWKSQMIANVGSGQNW